MVHSVAVPVLLCTAVLMHDQLFCGFYASMIWSLLGSNYQQSWINLTQYSTVHERVTELEIKLEENICKTSFLSDQVLLSREKETSCSIMETTLTTNAIPLLLNGCTEIQPLLQIIDVGSVTSLKTTSSHFHITLSDGTHQHKTLLPSAYDPQVVSGDIQIGSLILLKKAACTVLQNSSSIRVVELEVVKRSAALIMDTLTLQHAQVGSAQFSSSSAVDTLHSVVTPPTTAATTTIPFTALNPYRKYWSIQGRASAKTSLKAYNNVRGSGKVFGFDLINRDKEEIHLSAFAELAESLYNLIQVGQLYIVSNGIVREANPNYNHLKNKWEIYLFAASTINPCPTDDPTFPYQSFHFKTIAEVKSATPNTNVDVIGVVTSTSPASRKDGSETLRKTLILKDKSGFSIDVTLWGDHCDYIGQHLSEFYSFDNPTILAIKGGRVSRSIYANHGIPEFCMTVNVISKLVGHSLFLVVYIYELWYFMAKHLA